MMLYMETAIKKLAFLLRKLLSWLKAILKRIEANKTLCKKIIICLVVVLAWVCGMRFGANKVQPETKVEIRYITVPQTKQTEQADDSDVKLIAKVLYGMQFNNPTDLEGVVWVILNRVDSPLFPNSISEVCNQPSQWMGYSDTNPVVDDLYKIAEKVLSEYDSDGRRLFGKDFLFFTWSQDYIVFRTEFKESNTCRYWRSY